MIDSLSPLHPPNFANHSSRTSCLRTPLCFSSLSMFRRPSPPAGPHVRRKRTVPPFSCPSFRPDGLRNLPCPARIQPRICCSCARFRLFLFNFHPVLASIVRCGIRICDAVVWHMACEPALRLGTSVVSACGAPQYGGSVLFYGVVGGLYVVRLSRNGHRKSAKPL